MAGQEDVALRVLVDDRRHSLAYPWVGRVQRLGARRAVIDGFSEEGQIVLRVGIANLVVATSLPHPAADLP
jgi:hypothetical protein